MREDFRKKTSSQFTDEMRQMRTEARELAKNEADIATKMDDLAQSKRKTLSDSGERKELAEQLKGQKQGLNQLLSEMRQVTEKAEAAEPLLSKQLYDTLRKSDQGKLDSSLDNAAELLRRSFLAEASQYEERARKGIDDLKRGVERAAESVLGDEASALQLARKEVESLAQQLEREIAQADPNATNRQAQATGAQSGKQSRSPQQGKEGSAQSRSGKQAAEKGQSEAGKQPGKSGGKSREIAQQGKGQSPSQSSQSPEGEQGKEGQEGQQPGAAGQKPGQQAGGKGGGKSGQPSEKAEQPGQAPAQQQGQSEGQGQGQAEQAGKSGQASAQDGAPDGKGDPSQRGERGARGAATATDGGNFFDNFGGGGGPHGPLTGNEYLNWSDRLRDVEEMVGSPELRRDVARIRDRARETRFEFKRHSKEPQWDLVRAQILKPLVEVRQRISEELARLETSDSLVPIDRDPVPPEFADKVRRYYEKLGGAEARAQTPAVSP